MAAPEHLTFLGHSTVLLEVEGVRLITDPVLRRSATFLRRVPHAADLRGYTDVDVVLLSHLHHDHLDLPSLRSLRDGCQIVAPNGAGEWLQKKGIRNVVELAPGEQVVHGEPDDQGHNCRAQRPTRAVRARRNRSGVRH